MLGLAITTVAQDKRFQVASPDGRLVVSTSLDAEGGLRYELSLNGAPVLQPSRLGLVREDADFSRGLKLVGESRTSGVRERYEILNAKRRLNTYRAQRKVLQLENGRGQRMDVIFQVSNDGVAFRYRFPETSASVHRLAREATTFAFLPGTRAWLQPMAVAKSGWEQTNPSYEEYYEKDVPAGTPSPLGAGWVYPALFRTGDTWLLVSEAALGRNYCGTRLRELSSDGEYMIDFPDPRENRDGGAVNPESTLPWVTPWRLVVVGDLPTITESMLGVDLADKPARPAPRSLRPPGHASWSWPLLGDPNTTYEVQKRFIDYAAEMGWQYTLIDALWDKQIGYERVQELIDYARTKNVAILLWYNSAGNWNSAPQTPRDVLLTRESRTKEFERLKAMGVAGLKIDFFGGDGQSMINYYHDLLEESAAYGFLINFHGSTLPRGWQRTYPHLMTMESIRGLEFVTFEQANADQEPSHATMLPFTRNVFDPMDFTPMVLDRINRIERRTTSAFELALPILFTSGIQHYAEIPDGMAKAPDYVRDFLKRVPAVWDDVKFIAGSPGDYVVLARKSGRRWFVAGINGEPTNRAVALDLSRLRARGTATLIGDGDGGNLSFRRETLKIAPNQPIDLLLPPHGGFVMVIE
jgi:alpha-glucosidase